MRQVPTTVSSLLLVSAISAAYAQDAAPAAPASAASAAEPSRLETTVITGSRTARSIDKIPGAVTVISKQEVERSLAISEDATAVLARTVPGYSESSQALTNSGETLRGRIALRLFDGVPQTSPLRETNRAGSFTDMGIVGRVEVINGPSAAEGIGAAGGIINYISKTPEQGTKTTLTTRFSSQGRDDSEGWKVGIDVGHKEAAYDLVFALSTVERGMAYDADGRRVGLRGSGSIVDSKANNLFLKVGSNFGSDGEQRLQATVSRFNLTGKGGYKAAKGNRAAGLSSTSEPGAPLGGKTEFNDFNQYSLNYSHANVLGGTFTADVYAAKQAMRYPAESGSDRQDPLIAPLGTLIDQSEVNSAKKGLRLSWTRDRLLDVKGLELRTGLDLVEDTTDQRLALTNRVWVPPMIYKSLAPYAQLSYDIGALTVSGGLRKEKGDLTVDTFTTTYYNKRVVVEGGSLDFAATLPNIGMVYRVNPQLSAYASYSKGFSLPNVGIPLRNINKPGQSVAGILDLQAIVVDNKELGFNWANAQASLGMSLYKSHSDLGVSLSTDPVTGDFVMNRGPVDITGFELTSSYRVSQALRVNALYSRVLGKTWFVKNGPIDKHMGVNDINPDKLGLSMLWNFVPQADLTLGTTTLRSRTLNTGEHTRGYTLMDFAMNYQSSRYGRFTLGIENLLNRQYILSYAQASSGDDDYMAGRGRVISVSHSISF